MIQRYRRHQLVILVLLGLIPVIACGLSLDYGAACLQQIDSQLFVRSREVGGDIPSIYSGFVSADGGLTWQGPQQYPEKPVDLNCVRHLPLVVSDPRNRLVQYRLLPGGFVERSIDSGQTWQSEIDSLSLTEPEAAYYARSDRPYYEMIMQSDPQDMLIDPATGNVVVARGHVGVVVRTPDGQWHNIRVGSYAYAPLSSTQVATLLSGELLLALAVPVMITGIGFLMAAGWRWRHVLIGLPAWLLWLLFVFLSPARSSLFFSARDSGPASFCYLPLFLALLWNISCSRWLNLLPRRALLVAGLGAIVSAFLFYVPYTLWAWTRIPSYDTARNYALILVVVVIAVTCYILRRLSSLAEPGS